MSEQNQTQPETAQTPAQPTPKPEKYRSRLHKMSNRQLRGELLKFEEESTSLIEQAIAAISRIAFDNAKYTYRGPEGKQTRSNHTGNIEPWLR